MLFPGISQIQSALIGMAAGALLAGVGGAVLTHKIDNGRYEALVASQASANAKAVVEGAKAAAEFDEKLRVADAQAEAAQKQLDAERAKKQTVLVQTLHDEGKKDATLAHCLSYKLPASVLKDLPK